MNGVEGSNGVSPLVAAAHELKAPLALVRQISLHLQDESLTKEQRSRLLEQTMLTAERALRLTTDLTKAARLEDALFELEPINPDQLCRDVARELSALFEAHGRTISVKYRKNPLLLVANRDLLRRVLLSFGDNALHYSSADRSIELHVQALKSRGVVRVGVRDYGPALSADLWRTLRDKMTRSPQAIHARPESSGLGLYIASQFAEAMNGTIGVTRHKDGATFYVELQSSSQLSLL